jgi:type I restriction enzyme S subunit
MVDEISKFRLGDRCVVKSSKRVFAEEYVEFGIPFFRSKDVIDKALGEFHRYDLFISEKRYRELSESHGSPRKGEILISSVGNRSGQSYVVQDEGDFYFKDGNIIWLSDFKELDPWCLSYWLKSTEGQRALASVMIGSAQKALTIDSLRNLSVQLPSFAQQKNIAVVLRALDDKIELNRRMNATLEAMARALFQSWFMDFDPVRAKLDGEGFNSPRLQREGQGFESPYLHLFPDSFQDSELGHIPKGWTAQRLPDAIEVNPRRSLKGGTSAPYLDMKNLPTQGHSADEVIDREFSSGTKFQNGDTLLARITPCLENGKTGYVDFLEDGQVGWGSTEYIVLCPKPPLPPQYGYLLARSDALRTHAIQNMTGTSGRQRVPSECFNTFWLAVPPLDVARRFDELTAPLMAKIKANSNESRTLATLRDTLLPKLLSGELRVDGKQPSGVAG